MSAPLDRMPDSWWTAYGEEVEGGVEGEACAQLRHICEEEREIELLDRGHRVLDGIAALRFVDRTARYAGWAGGM